MDRYFGIDFGTTNIAVASLMLDKSQHKKFPNIYNDDGAPFPSYVAIDENEECYVGSVVRKNVDKLQKKGYTVVKSVKTKLGTGETVKVGDKRMDPVKIAGYLVKGIKGFIEEKERSNNIIVNKATVAVPVGFTCKQRQEIKRAFNAAGIQVERIVTEPMAAYISNRNYVRNYTNVMVFDWGGGTLDISILNNDEGRISETATLGWPTAGDKIDECVAEFVHNQLLNEGKLAREMSFRHVGDGDRMNLLFECEQAKFSFSEGERSYNITLPDYCGKTVFYKLAVEDFNEKIRGIVTQAVNKIDDTLEKANMSKLDINAVIMVGGSSNLLLLKSIIAEKFPKEKYRVVYPDQPQWSVAEGAAVIEGVDSGYRLNQSINLFLSGHNKANTDAFPILEKGVSIPHLGQPVSFGTVNNAPSANFIFGDDKDNLLGKIFLPSRGFLDELYYVKGEIDETLVATISVYGSYITNEEKPRILQFNELSLYCDISEIDDYI